MRLRALLLILAITLASPCITTALTIEDFTLDELVTYASVAGVFKVDDVQHMSSHVVIRLAPQELWFGPPLASPLEIALDRHEAAMPHLVKDETYVLFLRPSNQFEKVIGFRWSVLRPDNGLLYDADDRLVTVATRRFVSRSLRTGAQALAATSSAPLTRTLLRDRVRRLAEELGKARNR